MMTLFVFEPPKSGLLQQSIPDGLTFLAVFLKSEILCLKETHVLTPPEHAAPYTGSMHFSTVDGPWELMERSYCLRHRVAILMIQPNLTALFSVPDQHAKESPAGSDSAGD